VQSLYGFTELGECLLDLDFDHRKELSQKLVEFAFNEAKGRAAEFRLETDSLAVKAVALNLSKSDLDVEAAKFRDLRGKRALVMAVTALPDRQVYGWSVTP
jgi:hypothetical protein